MPVVEPLSSASIHVISARISKPELNEIAKETFETMVKAVVDVEKRIMAVGGELHADANAVLLEQGSHQERFTAGTSPAWSLGFWARGHFRLISVDEGKQQSNWRSSSSASCLAM